LERSLLARDRHLLKPTTQPQAKGDGGIRAGSADRKEDMPLSAAQKSEVVNDFGKTSTDTGSTAVQVALLTKRIEELSQHLQAHRKDHHSRRGLLMMVGKRKRLLSYLEREDYEAYKELIQRLGLRR